MKYGGGRNGSSCGPPRPSRSSLPMGIDERTTIPPFHPPSHRLPCQTCSSQHRRPDLALTISLLSGRHHGFRVSDPPGDTCRWCQHRLVRLGDGSHTAFPPSQPLAHKSSGLLLGLSPGLWESGLVSRSWKFLKALNAIHARRSPTMSPFGKFRSLLSYTCCTVVR